MRPSRPAVARAQREADRLRRRTRADPAAVADAFLADYLRAESWDEDAIKAFLARPLEPVGQGLHGAELIAEIERLLAEISSLPPSNECFPGAG